MVAQLKKVASFARSAIVSLTFLVAAIPIRGQECRDVATAEQSADWHVRPAGKPHRLNPRAVDSVEVPDESEDLAEPQPLRDPSCPSWFRLFSHLPARPSHPKGPIIVPAVVLGKE